MQWLRLHVSKAGSVSLIPGQRTKIPHTICYGQKKKKEKERIFCLPSTSKRPNHLPPSLPEEFNSVDHLLFEMLSPLDSQDPHTLLGFLLHQSFSVSFAGSSSSSQPCQSLNALSSLPRPLSYLYSQQPTLKIISTCPIALTTLSNSVTSWTVAC